MRAEITALDASILINGVVLGSLDSAVMRLDPRIAAQKEKAQMIAGLDEVQLEFVEAPAALSAPKPEKTRKISDRDSAAQDTTPEKEKAAPETPPKIESLGPADQLEQHRLDFVE